jgi:cytochrome c biogenesis protein CcdA
MIRKLLAIVLIALAGQSAPAAEKLVIQFFGSATCGECLEIKETFLFPAQQQHPEIDLRINDVDSDSGMALLLDLEKAYGVTSGAAIQLYFPDTMLSGSGSIQRYASGLIEHYLAHPGKWAAARRPGHEADRDLASRLAERFKDFSFISILAAGIADGLNPCAIATMIFLISFLATRKKKRAEILAIGLAFTAAVFTTYFLMGVGAFQALTFLQKYAWISVVVRWSAVVLAAGVGLYSFRDAFIYHRTGRTQDLALQLPTPVKLRIHRIISGQLSGRGLVAGALLTGFLVTLLEAVCTGQMYLPTIILMTRQSGLRLTGWLYLLFYNFLFVLPLLIVMVLAYFGLTWDRLAKTTQRNLTLLKVLFGAVLIGLAVFLAVAG